MTCHNLCATKPPPNNHAMLLGLGGKHCIQTKRLDFFKLKETITRFKYDVRVKHYVLHHIGINDTLMPKLYFKNASCNLPTASPVIEGAVSRFEKALISAFNLRNKRYGTNITKMQENILLHFQNHPECIILLKDKNLGPCTMNRSDYVKQALEQHLSDKASYERISETVAMEYLKGSIKEFFACIRQPGYRIEAADCKYLVDGTEAYEDGTLAFYCLLKGHECKQPAPMHPAVAAIGSMLCILGKWVAKVMKPASSKASTYLRYSNHLIEILEKVGEISDNDCIFAADAVAMHPNVDREEVITALIVAFEANLVEYDKKLPIKPLIQ